MKNILTGSFFLVTVIFFSVFVFVNRVASQVPTDCHSGRVNEPCMTTNGMEGTCTEKPPAYSGGSKTYECVENPIQQGSCVRDNGPDGADCVTVDGKAGFCEYEGGGGWICKEREEDIEVVCTVEGATCLMPSGSIGVCYIQPYPINTPVCTNDVSILCRSVNDPCATRGGTGYCHLDELSGEFYCDTTRSEDGDPDSDLPWWENPWKKPGRPIDEYDTPPPEIGGIGDIVTKVISYIFPIAGFICLIFIIQGGYMWMVSSGNPENVKKAQGTLTWALIGLILTMTIFGILTVIINFLYK
jgi:hypothetical protein